VSKAAATHVQVLSSSRARPGLGLANASKLRGASYLIFNGNFWRNLT